MHSNSMITKPALILFIVLFIVWSLKYEVLTILKSLTAQCSTLGLVRLFSIHMDWRGLIRIEGDFDLLGIETPSILLNPYGLG
jgi:hypothetical protein